MAVLELNYSLQNDFEHFYSRTEYTIMYIFNIITMALFAT